jgi:hypothetical protein
LKSIGAGARKLHRMDGEGARRLDFLRLARHRNTIGKLRPGGRLGFLDS